MDKLEREHRAQEAKRLMNEPLLAEAIATLRMNALLALSEVDANNTSEVLKYQAIAAVAQEIKESLEAIIVQSDSMQPEEEPG